MKKRHLFKHRKNTVRVKFSPDYDHPAWREFGSPTPDLVPDAFYRYSEPVHPRVTAPSTRRKPHQGLSAAMLRKRLYRAGLRGLEAKCVLRDILAGESDEAGNAIPGSWRTSSFRQRFGRRVAREVLRFVHIRLVVLDEFGYYSSPGFADLTARAMSIGRKQTATPLMVTQTLSQFIPVAPAAKRVFFQY